MKNNAIFPGTFNPIHEGHLEIIKKASLLFDKLYVLVAINDQKKHSDLNQTYKKAKEVINKLNLKNVFTIKSNGLVVDELKKHNCNYVIRGIRDTNDTKYELNLCRLYEKNFPNLNMVFFVANNDYKDFCSSKLNNKKIFVFDIDGTILNDDKQILSSTKKAINQLIAQGNLVILATGRPIKQMLEISEKLKLNSYLIGNSGGCIYNLKTKKYDINPEYINHNDVKIAIDLAKKYHRELIWSNGKKNYRCYFGKDYKTEIQDPLFFIGGTYKNPIYNDWLKVKKTLKNNIISISIKAESWLIKEIYKEAKKLISKDTNMFEVSKVYLQFTNKKVSKYAAIAKIQRLHNISNDNTYAFGDSEIDLSMIKNVKYGIAMGNASEKLKDNAYEIIGTNNENSIYNFLLKEGIINE